MSSSQQHYEDAVLNGLALVLLDLPAQLRGAVLSLRKMLDDYHPDNGITHVLVNDAPVRSTSGEDVKECGVVFFRSAKATWALLDKVEVVLRTEDGPLELRRGYLQLGPQKILVEGVVTWGTEGRERPVQTPPQQQQLQQRPTPTTASTAAAVTKAAPAGASPAPQTPRASPQPVAVPPASQRSTAPPAMAEEKDTVPQRALEKRGEQEGTVVIAMHFKEVYSRHRDLREDERRTARGGTPTMFPLSPFMVYQALIGECTPRKIVVLRAPPFKSERVVKVLVELENPEVAAHIIRVFTRRGVEFVSERDGPRNANERRLRRPEEKSGPKPISAEVRYFVNAYFSVRNGQSRFTASGERNYHHNIAVREQNAKEMSLVDTEDAALVAVRAPREWKVDSHANRSGFVAGQGDLLEREQRGAGRSPHGSTAASQREPRRERGRSDERTQRGYGGRRSRTPSRSHSYSSASSDSRSFSRSSTRSRSPSTRSSSSSSSSSRARHFRRRPRHEDSNRRDDTRRGAPDRLPTDRFLQPPVSAVPFTATSASHTQRVEKAAPVQQSAVRPQESVRVYPAAAAASSAQQSSQPLPPPTPAANDGLPPGWRPIFSDEYKQTYYAYRNPLTGVETTTWERPVA